MKSLRTFILTLSLVHLVISASLPKDEAQSTFTSELGEGFAVTFAKSKPASVLENRDADIQAVERFNDVLDSKEEEVNLKTTAEKEVEPVDAAPTVISKEDGIKEESASEQSTTPGFITNVISGFQNLTNSVIPNNGTNLLQNIQQSLNQTFQSVVNPQSDEIDGTTPAPSIFQVGAQAIQNFQQNINSFTQGIFAPVNSVATTTTEVTTEGPNVFQYVQNQFSTFSNNVLQGWNNFTSFLQTNVAPSSGTTNVLQDGFTNLTNSIQNVVNPATNADTPTNNNTNIFQAAQSVIEAQVNRVSSVLSNIFRPSANQNVREQFRDEIQALNETFSEGVKNVTEYLMSSELRIAKPQDLSPA